MDGFDLKFLVQRGFYLDTMLFYAMRIDNSRVYCLVFYSDRRLFSSFSLFPKLGIFRLTLRAAKGPEVHFGIERLPRRIT